MLELIIFYQVSLAVTVAIGFATGLWMLRAGRQGDRSE